MLEEYSAITNKKEAGGSVEPPMAITAGTFNPAITISSNHDANLPLIHTRAIHRYLRVAFLILSARVQHDHLSID
jgi:hypothetical protein